MRTRLAFKHKVIQKLHNGTTNFAALSPRTYWAVYRHFGEDGPCPVSGFYNRKKKAQREAFRIQTRRVGNAAYRKFVRELLGRSEYWMRRVWVVKVTITQADIDEYMEEYRQELAQRKLDEGSN